MAVQEDVLAEQLHGHRVADMDAVELGFLAIPLHAQCFGRHTP